MNIMLSLFFIIISALLTRFFCNYARNIRLIDVPNERNLHVIPTARGGGIIFIGLALISWLFICITHNNLLNNEIVFLLSVFVIATISFFDDLFTLSVKLRFAFQCLIALLLALFMQPAHLDFILFSVHSSYIISPMLFVLVIGAINHFNFMDGMDGFCALQAIFLLIAYAFFFYSYDVSIYQDFCLILISCLVGFLFFNFPPARIFMGDIGSASLGLITFCIALIAQKEYQIPIIYWFVLNSLFLFDSTITLCRRIKNRENWLSPHKKHAYQRLKQLGISTRMILLGQILLNILFLILVLLNYFNILPIYYVLFIPLFFLCFLYYAIEKKFPMQ